MTIRSTAGQSGCERFDTTLRKTFAWLKSHPAKVQNRQSLMRLKLHVAFAA
jgi:hypothetical protein